MTTQKETTLPKLGCVLYVDGGCRPGYQESERCGGWGIHGYTYTLDKPVAKPKNKKDTPTTEGYSEDAAPPADKQVELVEYIDAHGSMSTDDASDRAELLGFRQALEIVKEKAVSKVHFLLDNQYVIEGVKEGYVKWSSMDWRKRDGGQYANQEMWTDIMENKYYPLSDHVDFSIQWVNGHSGNLGNDRADYLATKGVYLARNGKYFDFRVQYSPTAKYRDPKPNINRLFAKNRWYFNTSDPNPQMTNDGRYVYHVGAHGPDNTLVGKPTSDSVAAVIYTKGIQHVLEAVRQRHIQLIDNPLNDLCMARLDTLLLPRVYDEIEKDGVDVLSKAPRKLKYHGLCTIDEQEVTRLIQPSGLTFKLIEVHNFMEHELQRYLDGEAVATDITDVLYETVETKKKPEVKFKLDPTTDVLRLKVKCIRNKELIEHQCALTIGLNIPSKELLRAVKDVVVKVSVVTWIVSEVAFRYGVIVETKDDVMFWMGKDCNLQFMYPDNMLKGK